MKIADYFQALKFRFNRYPSHLILFVTARCNARCRHCFYWKEISGASRENELTLEEISRISSSLGHVKFLSITGGEPSLRNDLPNIISFFCRNNQTRNVVIHTNGLLTDSILESVVRTAAANPELEINVSVSIDAMGEQHDLIRGVPGLFGKAVDTLDALKQAQKIYRNINVTVNTCFNGHNQEEVRRLSGYLYEQHEIDGFYVSWVRGDTPDPTSNQADIRKYMEETGRLWRKEIIGRYYRNYPLASLRRTLDFLAPKVVAETVVTGKMPYPCMAGKSVVVITETGEIKPCEMLRESFGNVRDNDYDLKKMLRSSSADGVRNRIAEGGCCCTWECAVMNNLVFNWRAYPRVIRTWLELEFERIFGR